MSTPFLFGHFGDQEGLSLLRNTLESALRDHEESPVRLWDVLTREVGLGAVVIDEQFGGLGGGAAELWSLMEVLGRSSAWTPYLASNVLGAGALRLAGGELAARLLPKVAAGETGLALAYLEPGRRNAVPPHSTFAVAQSDAWCVNGAKVGALGLGKADFVIFSASGPGAGVTLFCVATDRPGLSCTPYATIDGESAGDLVFDNLVLTTEDVVGQVGAGLPLLEQVIDEATAAASAAACGTMHAMIERTVDYCKQRRQFGKPLSDFQVLQHRLVDMHAAAQQATSLTQVAFAKLSSPIAERREAVSGAKYLVAEALRTVSQGAVQLHGGIGTTEELAIGRYFKRALMLEHLFGGATYHLERYRHAHSGVMIGAASALATGGEQEW